jgi:hypothetical protein
MKRTALISVQSWCFAITLAMAITLSRVVIAQLGNYPIVVLGDGAGPYYRLGESGGVTASDASSLGENGTYSAGGLAYSQPSLLIGESDGAVLITGAGVVGPHTADPASYTIEGWFRATAASIPSQTLVARVNTAGVWVQMLAIDDGGAPGFHPTFVQWVRNPDSTQNGVHGTTTVLPNVTYHVVGTFAANGQMRLYVDGLAEGAPVSVASAFHGDHWQIGLAPPVNDGWSAFLGFVDEVAFYGQALSPDLVLNHYYLGTGQPTLTATATNTPTSTPTPTPTLAYADSNITFASSSATADSQTFLGISLSSNGVRITGIASLDFSIKGLGNYPFAGTFGCSDIRDCSGLSGLQFTQPDAYSGHLVLVGNGTTLPDGNILSCVIRTHGSGCHSVGPPVSFPIAASSPPELVGMSRSLLILRG